MSSELAHTAARDVAGRYGAISTIDRFPMGLCHYVFDVTLANAERLVIRVADPGNRHLLAGAMAWSALLRPLGVPLPMIISSDLDAPLPYLVLERIPGRDLGDAYASLTEAQRMALAQAVSEIQLLVRRLGPASGYGYSYDPTANPPERSWSKVVHNNLRRSGARLGSAPARLRTLHAHVKRLVDSRSAYFAQVRPLAFLDDLTTKNVLVQGGRLTGIVDVDLVCFGDPLYTPALTKVALVASGAQTDYVAEWLRQEQPDAAALDAFNVYCAVFCMDLLSESGVTFNRDEPEELEQARMGRLVRFADEILAQAGSV
ncbi:MAG: hypothetical protein JWM40_779 [Frankiales bacterium]|nr:hypothetical protein [Frankiales bacterium]